MIKHSLNSVNDSSLSERFQTLLHQHVHKLTFRGSKARGVCPLHGGKNPYSFSADIEKNSFHCFGCGASGGVKRFAELLGEPWAVATLPPLERRRVAVSIRRHQAEQKARAILQSREANRLDELFSHWRDANEDAAAALELLALFHRRSDLAEEFPDLASQAANDYSAAIHSRIYLEAMADGEVMR